MLHGVAVLLHLGRSFLGDKVEDTAECDTPGLCGGVGGSVNLDSEVRLVLCIVLVYTVCICAAGVGDRYEVYVLPCTVVVCAVGAVSRDCTHSVLPDVQDAYELLCEALEGCGCREVVCGDVLGESAAFLVLCQDTQHGDCEAVGRVGQSIAALAGDKGLVGDGAVLLCSLQEASCKAYHIFGSLFQGGTAVHGNLILVVAVSLRVLSGLVAQDDNVVLLASGNVYDCLCQCILVLRLGEFEFAGLCDGLAHDS